MVGGCFTYSISDVISPLSQRKIVETMQKKRSKVQQYAMSVPSYGMNVVFICYMAVIGAFEDFAYHKAAHE